MNKNNCPHCNDGMNMCHYTVAFWGGKHDPFPVFVRIDRGPQDTVDYLWEHCIMCNPARITPEQYRRIPWNDAREFAHKIWDKDATDAPIITKRRLEGIRENT